VRRARGSGERPKWNPDRKVFELRVTLADGTRRWIRETTERQAEKARDQLLGDLESGLPTPSERLTLGDYLDEWLESVRVSTLAPEGARRKRKRKTYVSYEGLVRVHIKPAIGKRSLKLLSADQVQRELIDSKLAAGCSPRRVEMMRATLRIALNRAVALGMLARNVAGGKLLDIDVPNNSRVAEALEPDETTALLEAVRGYRYGPLVTLLVTSGLRLGEALALRWSEVNLKDRYLRVEKTLEWLPKQPWSREDPKANSSKRRVPLVAPAIEALQAEQDRQTFARRRVGEEAWLKTGLVFTNDRGDAIRERCVQDGFKDGLRRAGLASTVRVHDLRHTAASYLHMLKVPVPTIQKIMGHSTMAMTQRYAHVFEPMVDEARETLDAYYALRLPGTTGTAT
jgi:integrase